MTNGAQLPHQRLKLGARALAPLILAVPVFILGDNDSLIALVALVAVWSAVTMAERLSAPGVLVVAVESALVGVVAALTLPDASPVVGALALPPFTAGLSYGVKGAAWAFSAQVSTLVTLQVLAQEEIRPSEATDILTWLLTGVGLGLIASYLHAEALRHPVDKLAPYRDAQKLIRELLAISGNLGSGLDPITLGTRAAVAVRNELPVIAVAVYVQRGDHLTPLVSGSNSASVDQSLLEPISNRAWESQRTELDGRLFALPLRTGAGPVAVASGLLPAGTAVDEEGVRQRLADLAPALSTLSVHLDTAMLFSRLRDAATADERRRLAREMHDGVAQDIASLGYLVDALAASPASPAQAESLRRLRERITAVVAQVRLSVQTLRTDVQASESLGAAVSGLARHLSESSGIPIRVTVNERTARLRPEIEAELLRITQEAMTNAVRHSRASTIDVTCRVAAPAAEIMVRDDGSGLGTGRPDSYGLAIMRERAGLIDADLQIESVEPSGTVVTVRVPSRHASASLADETRPDRVSA